MPHINKSGRWAYDASLLVEAIVGVALIGVVVWRLQLRDFAVILPVVLVVLIVGVVAFTVRKRIVFWCGAMGATAGGICPKPKFEVLFSPNADPADVAVAWYRMIGEINMQYAIAGGIIGIALAYAALHLLRRGVSRTTLKATAN